MILTGLAKRLSNAAFHLPFPPTAAHLLPFALELPFPLGSLLLSGQGKEGKEGVLISRCLLPLCILSPQSREVARQDLGWSLVAAFRSGAGLEQG